MSTLPFHAGCLFHKVSGRLPGSMHGLEDPCMLPDIVAYCVTTAFLCLCDAFSRMLYHNGTAMNKDE